MVNQFLLSLSSTRLTDQLVQFTHIAKNRILIVSTPTSEVPLVRAIPRSGKEVCLSYVRGGGGRDDGDVRLDFQSERNDVYREQKFQATDRSWLYL